MARNSYDSLKMQRDGSIGAGAIASSLIRNNGEVTCPLTPSVYSHARHHQNL
ncbi:MAG: hypothetical protein AAFY78_04825 [Cyanobacteria bacterium J06648_16]